MKPWKLFIFNVAYEATEDDLKMLFLEYMPIELYLVHKENGAHKGFGFVSVKNKETADRAIDKLNGMLLHGRPMGVTISKRTRGTLETETTHG